MSDRLEAEMAAQQAREEQARKEAQAARQEARAANRLGRNIVGVMLAGGSLGVIAGIVLIPGTPLPSGLVAIVLAIIAGMLVSG